MRDIRVDFVRLLLFTGLFVASREQCVAVEPTKPSSDQARKDTVVIAMRADVQTDSRVIRLVDVANITGGDSGLRDRLKQIDIEDALSPGETVTILPPQIEFRLRLAGIDVDRISIRGTSICVTVRKTSSQTEPGVVTSTSASTINSSNGTKPRRAVDFSSISVEEGPLEREIIQAAKTCLLNKLPWPSENIDIRLLQPIPSEVRQVDSAEGYECSAELRTAGPAVGRVLVRVIAEATKKPTFDVPVMLDVRHYEKIVLATKTIERGHLIAASDVYVDRQDVTELSDYCSTSAELVGTTAKRSVRSLMPMRLVDVEAQNRSENSVLIKRREPVKMTAKLGALNVTATGEALQDGRMGELIRIRNTESNLTVQGRVVGAGEVEISF